MIYLGLTGWGDHEALYEHGVRSAEKLMAYSSHFPTVEIDSSYYAMQPARNYEKWVKETPQSFRFIVKAHQAMTGHLGSDIPFESKEEMFAIYRQSVQSLQQSGKLGALLFQFPPWFQVERKNINYLRYVREQMKDWPVAIEFRNRTWYEGTMRERTLGFLHEQQFIHTVCDTPQTGEGCVPIVPVATNKQWTLVRLHGRNVAGWNRYDRTMDEWRRVRYLYEYNKDELQQWKEHIEQLVSESENVVVLFNNNSGGHAAGNAKQLMELLNIEYDDLAPRQLDLF